MSIIKLWQHRAIVDICDGGGGGWGCGGWGAASRIVRQINIK